jgi:Domain of unknown function (DUF397)
VNVNDLADWRSSRSCEGGACVEIAAVGPDVLIRNSGQPGGARLSMSHTRWEALLTDLKSRPVEA